MTTLATDAPWQRHLAFTRRRPLPSGVMIYQGRHHESAAWPDLLAWLDFLTAGNKRPRTLEQYERCNARLLIRHPAKTFGEFTDADLLAEISATSPGSRHIVRVPMARWFGWGYKTRRIPSNPADFLPDVKYRPNRNIKVFTATEVAALKALPYPDGLLMTVLLETGIRNFEARSLTVKRVDFRAQEVLVKEGAKGGKERLVPLTRVATGAFHELIETEGLSPDDHFWASHPGGGHRTKRSEPSCASTFQRWWTDCLDRAGVAYRKPHTTRHSYATRWLDTDLDEAEVQDSLGHESIRTTRDIYQHRNVGKTGEKMRAIEAAEEAARSLDAMRLQ